MDGRFGGALGWRHAGHRHHWLQRQAFDRRHSTAQRKFHTIERLTRTSGTNIFYEIIYEDPEKATGQWRATRTFVGDTRPGVNKVMEFVCENNRDYIPLFGPQGPPASSGRRPRWPWKPGR